VAKKASAKKQATAELKVSSLAISLKDEDFLGVGKKILALSGAASVGELPRDQKIDMVRKALPDLIAKKISDAVPDGFVLSQITFTGEVSGKPLGIGVSGTVSVQFEKEK